MSIGEEGRLVARLISDLKKIQKMEDPSLVELKQKIADGKYNPPSDEIACAILYGPPKK